MLQDDGTKAEILIGGMDQKKRDEIIDDFRRDSISTLICTNVLARGIDVPAVDLVINFEVPYISTYGWMEPDYANYQHRVGRTGRFGTDGLAVTLAHDENQDDMVEKIQKEYDIEIAPIKDVGELKAIYDSMRTKD